MEALKLLWREAELSMALKLLPILAAGAVSVLFLRPALAQTAGVTNSAVPQNGWALPVPANGWGTMLPQGNSAMMGNDHDHGDHGDHHHHDGPFFVTWPYPYYSGYGTSSSQPIVINVQAPPQPAPQPTGPPPPVPGVDTHPTVEQTPSGVEIVRGPGSS
jgi:hypothetical protein